MGAELSRENPCGCPARRALGALAAVTLLLPAAAPAQVGHDPSHSPFRDITTQQSLSFFVGRFAGNTTAAGVGARPGLITGLRFESRLSGPMDLWVTLGRIGSSRFVQNPNVDTSNALRRTGPVDLALFAGDIALIMSLSGRKSWHRLAPFLGVGFGIVTPQNGTTDASGYKVGSNFILAPTFGTRVFVGRRTAVRLEVRDYFVRYEWPLSYFGATDSQSNPLPPVLDRTHPEKQWTHNFSLAAGLTYNFNF